MSVFSFISRNYKVFNPTPVPKAPDALRFGILGTAETAPTALISPAITHPEVIVEAVASRDSKRSQAFAKKYNINKAYANYQELLNDPDIDAVYIPLPNGLHYEWAVKSLLAGKHVLLEKPSCSNADDTKRLFALAREKNLVLLEAVHIRFHPAIQKVRSLVSSGVIGEVTSVHSDLAIPGQLYLKDDSIKLSYELGGGALMDMGCYPIISLRYIVGEPTSVISAAPEVKHQHPKIDTGMLANFGFPNDAVGSVYVNFFEPNWGPFKLIPSWVKVGITVTGTNGEIYLNNYLGPFLFHSIVVSEKGKPKKIVKAYHFDDGSKGEDWWSTYRYQLEAFVDKLKGREPQTWVSAEDSIGNMEAIDALYEKSGLDKRPSTAFFGSEGFS